MTRIIGMADEFWRLRLTRVDTTDGFDFEWHDDILYRAPRVDLGEEVELFHVEAILLDDADHAVRIATFATAAEARSCLAAAEESLAEMTKSEFETAYFEPASSRCDEPE